ncbi:OBG-type G domain-containing protein [Forsythia ovata]|uniref:OBG-type G domain-containing protein n=1 Tax=Forsythia ovata TaxID=205694 RepID=A0ABD1TUH9_9LAMI
MGIIEKIKEIEAEMARTQKNKATEYHLGQLKAKIAKLRTQLLEPPKGSSGAGEGFEVTKFGHGRVALIGFPSVGKSTLLTMLTGTHSEAASYEFTTLTCIPGIIHYNDTKIQLLDLPGIIEGASEGKGRGRQVIAVSKSSDIVLMVLDASKLFCASSKKFPSFLVLNSHITLFRIGKLTHTDYSYLCIPQWVCRHAVMSKEESDTDNLSTAVYNLHGIRSVIASNSQERARCHHQEQRLDLLKAQDIQMRLQQFFGGNVFLSNKMICQCVKYVLENSNDCISKLDSKFNPSSNLQPNIFSMKGQADIQGVTFFFICLIGLCGC